MPKKIKESDEKEFISDYAKLRSIRALSEKWNISYRTAHVTLTRLGVKSPRAGGPPQREDYHPMLGIWSDRKIAREMNVSHQAVSGARKRRGIPSILKPSDTAETQG
jgi:hypothetical protein